MNNAGKSVAHCVSSLVKAASQGDESYTASSATETATSLRNLAGAARAVSATVSRQAPLDATSKFSADFFFLFVLGHVVVVQISIFIFEVAIHRIDFFVVFL